MMQRLYHKLLRYIGQLHPEKKPCPFDATVIPLMSVSYFRCKGILKYS